MNTSDLGSADLLAEAVSWRHHLHRHPELAFGERQTSEFVATQLERFGLKVHKGLAGTGVVGTLTRGTSRRSIGIRADMDALPIREESGAAHISSVPGVMHACGHDGHTAIALAAARVCSALPDLDGTVHFIFQPAEENEGGGRRMVEEGLFKSFPCDSVYALHNWPGLPVRSEERRVGKAGDWSSDVCSSDLTPAGMTDIPPSRWPRLVFAPPCPISTGQCTSYSNRRKRTKAAAAAWSRRGCSNPSPATASMRCTTGRVFP